MTVNTPPQSPSPRIASPDLSETHDQRPHSYGNLFDETLDTPFSFYTNITDNMEDYLVGTPEPHGQHDAQDASSHTRPVTPKKTDDNHEHTADVVMSPGEGHMSRLSLGDHSHTHTTPYHHQVAQPPLHMAPPYYGYSMYGQFPLSTGPPEQHSPHYHPYKTYPFGMRSPKSGRLSLPHEPLSPPLSISPPESPGSHHQLALLHTPPSAVSPSLVSPASAIGSTLSDVSPDSGGWTYPLPTQPSVYAATPLTSIHGLPQGSPTAPGLAMVAGYPYPSVSPRHAPPRRVSGRVTRGKAAAVAKQKGDSSSKHEKLDDDDDSDLDDIGSPAPRSSGALGLVPQEHRTILGSKREDVRKMRIESEQRRRDELREGFARLKEALPQSNQRSSKASLLDRSVQYIRDIDFANRYLSTENDALKAELAEVRQSNQELVHAMTVQSRTTSSPNGQA